MQGRRRSKLSQNFLHNRKLIQNLVGKSSIEKTDRVIEIGPGKGALTSELVARSGSVISVEIDKDLIGNLRDMFGNNPQFWLIEEDIRNFKFPVNEYKVFSNVPFAIEGEIVRKLLDCDNPPTDSYLIVRKEFAERLSGIPNDNQFSLKHKPWFEFSILQHLSGSEFVPVTKVNSVLWRIEQRNNPTIDPQDKSFWLKLIETGFWRGRSLKSNLAPVMGENGYKKMCKFLCIDTNVMPSYVGFQKWMGIYKYVEIHG